MVLGDFTLHRTKTGSYSNLVAKDKVVACPSAKLKNAVPHPFLGTRPMAATDKNYYLGYMEETDRKKTTQVTKPTETCMNGDGLDTASGLNWWNYGYLYPPSIPLGHDRRSAAIRSAWHSGNYSWVDGHVSMTSWN